MFANRPRRRTSHLLAALIVAAALVVPAGAVVAAPSEHFADHRAVVNCPELQVAGATASLFVSASDRVDAFADLRVHVAPAAPAFDPPTFVGGFADLALSGDDSTLTGVIELIGFETGELVGTALLEVSLTPDGEPETIQQRREGGNQQARSTTTTQLMLASGSLTVPDESGDFVFSLDVCSAAVIDIAEFSNAPSSTVESGDTLALQCNWDGGELDIRFEAAVDAGLSFADIAVITPQAAFLGSDDAATFTPTALETTLVLASAGQGLTDGGGIATANATLTPLDAVTWVIDEQNSRTKVRAVPLSVDGALHVSLDDGTEIALVMSDDVCQAFDRSFREINISRQGGNMEAPANDTPQSAAPITIGRGINAHTGGAALEGEATTNCLFIEDGFILNLAHTVWYQFVGTGAPVTIDTSGSDFDTVVAVYTQEAGSYTEVACGDDQALEPLGASRQANFTFDTELGVVYLIQAGGFLSESGHLKLRID